MEEYLYPIPLFIDEKKWVYKLFYAMQRFYNHGGKYKNIREKVREMAFNDLELQVCDKCGNKYGRREYHRHDGREYSLRSGHCDICGNDCAIDEIFYWGGFDEDKYFKG